MNNGFWQLFVDMCVFAKVKPTYHLDEEASERVNECVLLSWQRSLVAYTSWKMIALRNEMCMRAITIEDLLFEMEQTQQFKIFFTFHCANVYMYHTRLFNMHVCTKRHMCYSLNSMHFVNKMEIIIIIEKSYASKENIKNFPTINQIAL